VTRPLNILGVTRPVLNEGVIRPEIEARVDATDEGREYAPGPTVGGDSLATATNTPHLGGQSKYRLLRPQLYKYRNGRKQEENTHPSTIPLFFPLPAKPPPSSTPAHCPCFPSISPKKRNVPSKPKLSIRTLSPISYSRCVLEKTSDCLLSGRWNPLFFSVALGVFGREPEATEGGRDIDDPCDTVRLEYRVGSLDFRASMRELSKIDWFACCGAGCDDAEEERERNRPILPGVGMPDVLGLPGVDAIDA